MKKQPKKALFIKLSMLIIVFAFVFPLESNAGVKDWFDGLKSSYVVEGFTLASSGSLYANSYLSQDVGDDSAVLSLFQGNTLLPSSGISTTKTSRTTSVALKRILRVQASAYSSTVDQTDGDPFTTANGTRVRDGIIATNMLPFNTLVKIPDIYGDKIFTVTDRMNSRYQAHIDIWFPDRQTALVFGRKTVTMEIVGAL